MDAPELPNPHARSRALNPGQRLFLALITAYKSLGSPWYTGSCRYVPSCSDYAREAIVEHGAVRGAWLAMRRVARCNPFGAHGFDPVPRAGSITRS